MLLIGKHFFFSFFISFTSIDTRWNSKTETKRNEIGQIKNWKSWISFQSLNSKVMVIRLYSFFFYLFISFHPDFWCLLFCNALRQISDLMTYNSVQKKWFINFWIDVITFKEKKIIKYGLPKIRLMNKFKTLCLRIDWFNLTI